MSEDNVEMIRRAFEAYERIPSWWARCSVGRGAKATWKPSLSITGRAMSKEYVESLPSRWESLKTRRVPGIGGVTGKAVALSLIGGAVYGVIKLVELVTD